MKCLSSPYLEMEAGGSNGFACVTVYVKLKQEQNEQFRLDFHRSIGGQVRAFCECNKFPLISTGRCKKKSDHA